MVKGQKLLILAFFKILLKRRYFWPDKTMSDLYLLNYSFAENLAFKSEKGESWPCLVLRWKHWWSGNKNECEKFSKFRAQFENLKIIWLFEFK